MLKVFFVLAVSVGRVATMPTVTAKVCRSESTDGLHYASLNFFVLVVTTAPSRSGPPHYRGFTITGTYTRKDFSGRLISTTQRPLPNNTQHSQYLTTHNTHNRQTDAPSGIGTRNPSKRAAADPRFRTRGYWDRPSLTFSVYLSCNNFNAGHRL
jgi:hypothetical protein